MSIENMIICLISTHTLRGERDINYELAYRRAELFQLTRSVGSVTTKPTENNMYILISTHTLRGERDLCYK